MNAPKIQVHEQEFVLLNENCSCRNFSCQQQPWNMGVLFQSQQSHALEKDSAEPNPGTDNLSSTISSHFGSPTSALYATERYIGFAHHEYGIDSFPPCSQLPKNNDSEIPSHQPSKMDSADTDILQSVVKFPIHHNQNSSSFERSCNAPYGSLRGGDLLRSTQIKSAIKDAIVLRRHPTFEGIQNCRVGNDPFSSSVTESRPHLKPGKQSTRPSYAFNPVTSGNSVPSRAAISTKPRIRWTQDLHQQFVECVNRLGGAKKATPKGILKLMDSDALTIFQIKSHLQKYRIARYIPEIADGQSKRGTSIDETLQLDLETGMQIAEALRLQLDVQRRLHEQLEIQGNLQLRIEEQGRQLKKMLAQQQKTDQSVIETHNLDITFPENPTNDLEDDIHASAVEGFEDTSLHSTVSN